MPNNVAPKAYRNMRKGYGLWREGYVNRIFIKPYVQTTTLCLARVSASMKSIQYCEKTMILCNINQLLIVQKFLIMST